MAKGSFKFVIPTRRFELIRYLEQMIVSTRVHQLAEVLLKRPRTSKQSRSVEEFFGDKAKNIADHGLATLSDAEIDELMRTPKTLVQLQTWLLMYGGKYWEQRFGEARFGNETADMRRQRMESLGKVHKTSRSILPSFNTLLRIAIPLVVLGFAGYASYYVFLKPTVGKLTHFQKVVALEASGSQMSADSQLDALSQSIRSWSQDLSQMDRVRQVRGHCRQLIWELKILRSPQLGLYAPLDDEVEQLFIGEIDAAITKLTELSRQEFELEDSKAAFIYRQEVDAAAYRLIGRLREGLADFIKSLNILKPRFGETSTSELVRL